MPEIKTFPQVIFVTVEEDGQNDWLSANTTKEGALGDSNHVIAGVYQFVSSERVNRGPTVSTKRKTRAVR